MSGKCPGNVRKEYERCFWNSSYKNEVNSFYIIIYLKMKSKIQNKTESCIQNAIENLF